MVKNNSSGQQTKFDHNMEVKNIIDSIKAYNSIFAEEQKYKELILLFIEKHGKMAFSRDLEIGHITGSGFVINDRKDKVLLLHHKKLDKWLQPGGHCDGEIDTRKVALKEVFEETGIEVDAMPQSIFDIDIHQIPKKNLIEAHWHYDIRYLIEVKSDFEVIKNHESIDLKWVDIKDILKFTNEASILRMMAKLSV